MRRRRVLLFLSEYPQLSETYIKTEIESLLPDHDIRILSIKRPETEFANHQPFSMVSSLAEAVEHVEDFRPDVLHTHWLIMGQEIERLSRRTGVPFTIRTHSFDVLGPWPRRPWWRFGRRAAIPALRPWSPSRLNRDHCLGVLGFPFARPLLEAKGLRGDKIVDCWPVIDYDRFHDRSANGDAVMDVGAALAKKAMGGFLRLAAQRREVEWNLYAIGHEVPALRAENEKLGSAVRVMPPLQPEEMPAEYKRHRWFVHTSSREMGTVGWPVAVAEAQAAGVGVCIAGLRPDIRDYVGAGGVVYESMADVRDIVARPPTAEMREAGFVQARRSDIKGHRCLLTGLWERA